VPNLEEMVGFLKEKGVFVIEDFSQCLNGTYNGKRVGNFGEVGIYSSSSIKTMDTLGGGLAITDDETIAEGLRKAQANLAPPNRKFLIQKAFTNLVRNFATTQPFFSLLTFPFLQLIRKRNPDTALKQTGHRNKSRVAKLPGLWFTRYTSVQAGIALENMPWVSKGDEMRVSNVETLKFRSGVEGFPKTTPLSRNVYWQLILPVPDAHVAQAFLAKVDIDSATSSLELVCALQDYPNRAVLPVAENIYRNGIFIPCFPNLSRGELERISTALKKFFQEKVHAG
jgi:dTDP-4-amino-4,6-dideoxygalactose transaminase